MLDENYIIDRIQQLCEARDMTQYRLSLVSGVSQSSLSTMMSRQSMPTFETLSKICDGFGITLAQFFIKDGKHVDLTDEQEKVLTVWDSLDDKEKELIQAYVQGITRK